MEVEFRGKAPKTFQEKNYFCKDEKTKKEKERKVNFNYESRAPY